MSTWIKKDIKALVMPIKTLVKNTFLYDIVRHNRNKRILLDWRKSGIVTEIERALRTNITYIHPMKTKSDRDVALIGNRRRKWAVRREKISDPAVFKMKRWVAVAEKVASVGMRVPKTVAYCFNRPDPGGYIWMVQEYVEGAEFWPKKFGRETRLAVTKDVGRQLRLLHAVKVNGFGALSPDLLSGEYATFEKWLEEQSQTLESAIKIAGMGPRDVRTVRDTYYMLKNSYTDSARLCHGDCNVGNILVAKRRYAVFVDWYRPLGCDPAYDAAAWYEYSWDSEGLDALLAAYNPSDPKDFRQRVVVHALRRALFGIFLCWQAWWHKKEGEAGLRKRLEKILGFYRISS